MSGGGEIVVAATQLLLVPVWPQWIGSKWVHCGGAQIVVPIDQLEGPISGRIVRRCLTQMARVA